MAEEVKEQKQMSLDAILDETPPPAEVPEKPLSGPEAYQSRKREHRDKEFSAQGLERDPATGQYAKKETKEATKEPEKTPEVKVEVKPEVKVEKPVEEYSAREKAAFAKAADETRKRQALERQLADLKKEPQKPFYEDPDGTLERQRQEQRSELESAVMAMKVHTSESIARSRYPDYDEKFAVFNELVQKSPYLAEQAFGSQDPAEYAYQAGKTEKNLRDAGGVDKLREKMESELRAKVKAEIEAEYKKREDDLKRDREALPGSLTDVQSKGVNRPVWGGPPSFDDILKS